jgi:hypothetical protein
MALYMYQAAYAAESVAAQIKEPQDRIEAVKPALGALGGKIKSAKTTRLLTGQEWIESLRKAQGSQYRPAR